MIFGSKKFCAKSVPTSEKNWQQNPCAVAKTWCLIDFWRFILIFHSLLLLLYLLRIKRNFICMKYVGQKVRAWGTRGINRFCTSPSNDERDFLETLNAITCFCRVQARSQGRIVTNPLHIISLGWKYFILLCSVFGKSRRKVEATRYLLYSLLNL